MFQVLSELTAETLFTGNYDECEDFVANHSEVAETFALYIEEDWS